MGLSIQNALLHIFLDIFEYVATWTAPILYIFTFVRLISSAILEGKEAAFQVVYSLPSIIAF